MKRPLTGLLAGAAALPVVWILANAEQTTLPVVDQADEGSRRADAPGLSQWPSLPQWVEPAFGQPPPQAQAQALETTALGALAPTASPLVEPDTPSNAEPRVLVEQPVEAGPGLALADAAGPEVAALSEDPAASPVLSTAPAAPAAVTIVPLLAEAQPSPPSLLAERLFFISEPVVQPLPSPVLAQAEATHKENPAISALPSEPPAASQEPVLAVQTKQFRTPQLVLAAASPISLESISPPAMPVAPAAVSVVAGKLPDNATAPTFPAKPKQSAPLAKRLETVPPLAALARSVAAPKAPEVPALAVVAASAEPAAKPERSSGRLTAISAQLPSQPTVTALPVALSPNRQTAPAKLAEAVTHRTEPQQPDRAASLPLPPVTSKLPVGELVLAAFTPGSAAQPTEQATKARGALAETTAARTVPVGAPKVAYPEPAFGYDEARLIPAALITESSEPAGLPGSASTLAQAIAYSYETNPRLLAERASARSADMGYPAARAAFGPRLDASASLAYTRDRDEVIPGSFVRSQGWSDTASLILSQPLLSFGRNKAVVGQAAANIAFSRESLRLVQNEVMIDVIAAYVGTLREAGAVTIARENVALLQRQLEESNARFAVREITLADVQQVETRLALGRTLLLDSQARLGEVHSRFYRAVGMPPGELAPPEPLMLPVSSLADAYAIADTDSPLIRAAQARERASRAALAATRAESLPRVDFRGAADYGSISEYSQSLRGTRLRGQVTLSVPLFDSGARAAESGQVREANAADLQLVASAQRDSRAALATSWNSLLAARLSLDHYRLAVESAQRAYENAQRQERAGMRTTLDVLDLARDLLNVRNSYNAALANEYLARANVLSTLGRLEPQGMTKGLKLYDPADHFRKVRSKGDVPLLTGALAALDGIALPDLAKDRASPDAAQMVGTAETVTGE